MSKKVSLAIDRAAVADISTEMCVNCGICRRSCPVEAIDEMQRDICRLCPDCSPTKEMFPEESQNYATKHSCSLRCPLGTVPEGYVNMIAEGRFDEAHELIKELNPLPVTCSMICSHPCEDDCKRGLVRGDAPIAIRALKRFVLENAEDKPLRFIQKFDMKVAIIGAGPAGLTAAYDLASKGYKVKIFESGAEPGGMAKRAIPDFRLDKEKLAYEAQKIIDAGVEIEYGCVIGKDPSVTDLLNQGFDAVIIATGAALGVKLPLKGVEAEKVYDALGLMKALNNRKKMDLGKKAVVIGGGSVALDTARMLHRKGLEVTCACLEAGDAVPAPKWEIQEAAEEGITLVEGASPVRIKAEWFTVHGVEFQKVDRIERNEHGQLRPVTVDGSEFTIDCDTVVFAVGQKPNIGGIAEGAELKLTLAGRIEFNPETGVTSNPKIFVAGDLCEARGSMISAMASARKAALSVDNLLQGRELKDRAIQKEPKLAPMNEKIFPADRLEKLEPQSVPKARFRDTFEVVEGVFDKKAAMTEAARCMKCGYSAVDNEKCIGCGVCAKLCPANAISLKKN